MKKRIIISLALCVIMLLSVSAGCSKQSNVITDVSEAFRSIVVSEFNGNITVGRENGESVNVYSGLALHDGDSASVGAESEMVLDIDSDKHLYAPELTKFRLEATGDEKNSKTVIHLEEGCCLSRLTEKLTDGESYEVETANATLSVRGTVFYVSRYTAEDGAEYILLEVLDGTVHVELIDPNHKTAEEADFTANEAGLIRADGTGSQFVLDDEVNDEYWMTDDPNPVKEYDGNGKPQLKLTPEKMPEGVLKQLELYQTDGDEISITPEQIKALLDTGHDYREESRTEAGCAEPGSIIYKCSICGESYDVEIEATGHNYTASGTASCTEAGQIVYTCENCGDTYSESVDALGHSYGDFISNGDATCTGDGTKTATCSRCGDTITETDAGSALGHSFTKYVSNNDATPEKDGTKTAKCDRCGETDTVADTGSASGHSAGDAVKENETSATCSSEGSYDLVVYCTDCGEELSRTTVKISKLAHTEVKDAAVAATCTESGLTEGIHCSVCGEVIKTQTVAPAKGHLAVTDAGVSATCTESGLTEGSHCSVCGEIISKQEVIPAKGHTVSAIPENTATCTEDGNTAYWTCTSCGKYFSDENCTSEIEEGSWIIEATGHMLSETPTYLFTHDEESYCYTIHYDCGNPDCDGYDEDETYEHVFDHNCENIIMSDGTEETGSSYAIDCYCTNYSDDNECGCMVTHTLTPNYDETGIVSFTCECGETVYIIMEDYPITDDKFVS